MPQHTVERPDIGYTIAFPRGIGGTISVPVGRGIVLIILLVSSVLFSGRTDALDRTRLIRIGVLTASWGPTPQVVGVQEGLREMGYREHVHFDVAVRFTQGDLTALPIAARDLLGYGVDLIIVDADQPAKAAQQATTQIPIVFVGVSDPVGIGLVQSFARPGGNITGVTDLELGLGPKRLEVFRDLIPRLKRVLYPYDVADAYARAGAKIYRAAAHRLGLELRECPVRTMQEAREMLTQLQPSEVDGILMPPSHSLNIIGFILEAGTQGAIPTMFNMAFLVEQGGFASYGSDAYAMGRQAARLVDKIVKGTQPAEIPVETNLTIELAINLKVAKNLGVTIAPEVLYQADRLLR